MYYPNGYINRHNNRTCGPNHNEGCTPLHPSFSQMTNNTSTHSTILFSSLAATVLSLLILKLLYAHPGGGDGDNSRHVNVTRILLLSNNLCIYLNPLLIFVLWTCLPNERWVVVLPLGLLVRDGIRVKNTGSSLPSTTRGGGGIGIGMRNTNSEQQQRNSRGAFQGGTNTNTAPIPSSADRKTFFRALSIASLDILSRSLRRKSFVRVASILLLIQFVCVSLWWGALSVVLSVTIYKEDGVLTKFMHAVWVMITFISGKWATSIVSRLLGFVASGGVASWFGKQNEIIIDRLEREAAAVTSEEEVVGGETEQQQQQERQDNLRSPPTKTLDSCSSDHGDANTEDSSHAEDSMLSDDRDPANSPSGYSTNYNAARQQLYAMPEAYRTADASVYASVMDFDEGLDDDDDEEDEYDNHVRMEMGGRTSQSFHRSSSIGGGGGGGLDNHQPSSTVKSFLTSGCTISFGSVVQCALIGGVAQFLWSFVRNIDAMGFFLQQRRFRHLRNNGQGNSSSTSGFRGMEISVDSVGNNNRQWKELLATYWSKANVAIRGFVRSHSDLAMSHVAAYYKSYQRAANDVAVLIETSGVQFLFVVFAESVYLYHDYIISFATACISEMYVFDTAGVESIIHDDITTHMCSSVGHLVAGTIVLFFGMILVTHRNTFSSSPLADASLLEVLLFAYMLCYTILLTVLEPLRAAIKAVYVCFAEHPMSLSQAFPLIYQRLSRISEASSNAIR